MPNEVITREEWLSGRLSPARQESAVWVELFQVIEQWFDEYVFPAVERLKDARRTFGQDDEALNRLIDEFGDFFEVPEIDEEVRGIQRHIDLLWRRHELHKKRTTVAFDSYVNRVMRLSGLDFQWHPLYWRSGDDYATCIFYPQILENLSSRGCIILDLDRTASLDDFDWIVERMFRAQQRARKIIPEHLVLEPPQIHRRAGTFHQRVAVGASCMVARFGSNRGGRNVAQVEGSALHRRVTVGAKAMVIAFGSSRI